MVPWQMYAWGICWLSGGLLATPQLALHLLNAHPSTKAKAPQTTFHNIVWACLSGPFFGLVMNVYFVIGFVHPLT